MRIGTGLAIGAAIGLVGGYGVAAGAGRHGAIATAVTVPAMLFAGSSMPLMEALAIKGARAGAGLVGAAAAVGVLTTAIRLEMTESPR